MFMYFDEIGCEEVYSQIPKRENITIISSNMIVQASLIDGKMVNSIGAVVQAESVEMNCVKVTFPTGREEFYELGDKVKWVEVN